MKTDDKLYLRLAGGKVFGPVDLATIRQWAGDGRVEPSAAVSRDRKEWQRASDIAELEMEWVVENAPGQFYGPTHRAMVDELIKSGALMPTARFYRDMRSSLADRAEAEAAASAAQSRIVELEGVLSESGDELTRARNELAQGNAAVEEQKKENARLKARLDEAQSDKAQLESEKRALENEKSALESLRARLEAGQKTLTSEYERAEAERRRLARESETRESENASLRSELALRRKELAAATEELQKIKREREKAAVEVVVPEVMVEGTPPKAPSAFGRGPLQGAVANEGARMASPGVARPGGAPAMSLADLERAAQAELARMRESQGKKGFFFSRK